MLTVEDLVGIAIIGKSVGDEGFVQIKSQTDFPNHFLSLKEVFILFPDKKLELLEIEKVKYEHNKIFIKFKNVNNKIQSASLYKAKIMIEPKYLHPLPDDEYYQFQLIGLDAVNEDNKHIGIVIDYIENKIYDFILIETGQEDRRQNSEDRIQKTRRQVMIPFIDRFVNRVDIKNRTIFLSNVNEIIKIC
ncbi:MAG: 16S rRNA processing protein RimM [Candidatus Cloacimonadota bacterium]|nr:MAG: 16S rRNA processing protein RimM [Candidatus Cloacimonadota bacterium]